MKTKEDKKLKNNNIIEERIYFKKEPLKFCQMLSHELAGALDDIERADSCEDDECVKKTLNDVMDCLAAAGNGEDVYTSVYRIGLGKSLNE